MEYQKVGRGGAGNFYSQGDIAKAAKRATEVGKHGINKYLQILKYLQDLEAPPTATNVTPEDIEKARATYAHSGRGGAGNYTNATQLAAATAATSGVTDSLQESKAPDIGHYGRGGAGNYHDGDTEIKEAERRKSEFQNAEHQKVVKDVELGLKQPEKAHLGLDKFE